jgi:hypothetical protein
MRKPDPTACESSKAELVQAPSYDRIKIVHQGRHYRLRYEPWYKDWLTEQIER